MAVNDKEKDKNKNKINIPTDSVAAQMLRQIKKQAVEIANRDEKVQYKRARKDE